MIIGGLRSARKIIAGEVELSRLGSQTQAQARNGVCCMPLLEICVRQGDLYLIEFDRGGLRNISAEAFDESGGVVGINLRVVGGA